MRQIACMSNRLITQLSEPTLDCLTCFGALGSQVRQGIEPSEPSHPKNTLFPGGLDALHSKVLSNPETKHVLRRVSPIRGAYYVSRTDHPCETRFLLIQPPVM